MEYSRLWDTCSRGLWLAVAATVCCPGALAAQPTRAQPATARLLVNDSNAIGSVGDGRLSLDEAIRLANGSLSLNALRHVQHGWVGSVQGSQGATPII